MARPKGTYVSGVNQPRDMKGKFRTVLARIKQDLGDAGLQNVVDKVREAENLDNAGNYSAAVAAAADLLSVIERIDTGALNPDAIENIRSSTAALGQLIANLPLPFGDQTDKLRFTDLPPVLKNMIDDMMSRVEQKIGKKDADAATENLRKFKSGSSVMSQSDVSSEMNVMLRLLT